MGSIDGAFQEILTFKDALEAAKRRFHGIMPTEGEMRIAFKDHFVYFRPKDGLGGDFYTLHHRNETILVVADCSGHSVEGALLAMLASGEVENIVKTRDITEPKDIIRFLHKSAVSKWSRAQEESLGISLEVSVVNMSKDRRHLKFCGAMRPMLLLRDGDLIEYEKSMLSVGDRMYDQRVEDLRQHEIDLQPGDVFYLFTDGYETQPSHSEKPMGKKKFKEMIIEAAKLPIPEQRDFFDRELKKFRGASDQLDDICLIGVAT